MDLTFFLFQACSPIQVSVAPRSPSNQGWTTSVSSHSNTPVGFSFVVMRVTQWLVGHISRQFHSDCTHSMCVLTDGETSLSVCQCRRTVAPTEPAAADERVALSHSLLLQVTSLHPLPPTCCHGVHMKIKLYWFTHYFFSICPPIFLFLLPILNITFPPHSRERLI